MWGGAALLSALPEVTLSSSLLTPFALPCWSHPLPCWPLSLALQTPVFCPANPCWPPCWTLFSPYWPLSSALLTTVYPYAPILCPAGLCTLLYKLLSLYSGLLSSHPLSSWYFFYCTLTLDRLELVLVSHAPSCLISFLLVINQL